MTGPVTMDAQSKIFAVGFNDQDLALKYIKQQVDAHTFTEKQIVYKDNPFLIGPNMLRPLYIKIFGKRANIFFKDYVTNATIVMPPISQTNQYWSTFISLMNHLHHPRFLVIYKVD